MLHTSRSAVCLCLTDVFAVLQQRLTMADYHWWWSMQ